MIGPQQQMHPAPTLHQQVGHAQAQQPKVLIEKTAKKWKSTALIGTVIFGIGVAVIAGTTAFGLGTFMLAIGLIVFVYARLGAWWHHG